MSGNFRTWFSQANVFLQLDDTGLSNCQIVADVAFLVDSSGSVGRRNWGKMLQFLKDMVTAFNVGPDKTHIAIIAYSNEAVLEFTFDRLKGSKVTEAGYYSLIDNMRWQKGFTFIDKALILADEQVFVRGAGMRPELPQVRPKRFQPFS